LDEEIMGEDKMNIIEVVRVYIRKVFFEEVVDTPADELSFERSVVKTKTIIQLERVFAKHTPRKVFAFQAI
jgi:hypothetical protein